MQVQEFLKVIGVTDANWQHYHDYCVKDKINEIEWLEEILNDLFKEI
jgi:hypothetical protein